MAHANRQQLHTTPQTAHTPNFILHPIPFFSATQMSSYQGENKRAAEEIAEELQLNQKAANTQSERMQEAVADTVQYNPPPAPLPRLQVAPMGFYQQQFPESYAWGVADANRRAQEARWMAENLPLAQAKIAEAGLGGVIQPVYVRSPSGQLRAISRQVPFQSQGFLGSIQSDPLLGDLKKQYADATAQISSLKQIMTEKQKEYIDKRIQTITHTRKGKKAGEVKTPTTAQIQKVLMRAHELAASRRRAQLTAQVKRARAERHSLMKSKRIIYTTEGPVGANRRYYKKVASNDPIKRQMLAAKADAKQLRAQLTNINKADRLAVAQKYGRKLPKEKGQRLLAE